MDFLRLLEGIRNPALDAIFSFFTSLAGETILLAVLCILFWCFNKKIAYFLGFVFMGAQLVVNNMKLIFKIERPWIIDPYFKPVSSAVEGATGYSFPSGHTCAATSVYGTLGMKLKGVAFKIIAIVIIAGVMFSRMYLGVHTPMDVCVSFIVTALILALCLFIEKKVEMTERNRLIISVIFAVCALFSLVFAAILSGIGEVESHNAADNCKMAGAALAFVLSWFIETKYIHFNERGCKWPLQILKLVIGVAGVLGLRIALKALFTLGSDFEPVLLGGVRYFFMVLWAMCIFPIIIKRFFETDTKKEEA